MKDGASGRRRVLQVAGAAALVQFVAPPASAQTLGELPAVMAAFAQGKPVQRGRVKLDIAQLVDNGNVVPCTVSVESPMTAADHVAAISIFNEKNPQRDVANFTLGPKCGKAIVSTRMRLSTSQKVVAMARMSDGSVWSDSADVIVVLAACIEGDV